MGFFITLFLFALTTVLQEVLRPKPEFENARPANLGDFRFPTAQESRPVPLPWGTVKIDGPNVVWYGDLRQTPIRVKQKTGLFSSTRQTVGYRYNIGIQMSLCLGEVGKLLRIWVGDKELWTTGLTGAGTISINEPDFLGGEDLGNGGIVGDFSFLTGSTSQTANSYLSSFQSFSGDTPAYRGFSYIVWEGGYIGNSTNIKPFKFEIQRIPDGLDLATAHLGQNDTGDNVVNTYDANPANVIYEILTDTRWGLGVSASNIDLDSFRTAGGTFATEGNGISMVVDSQKDALDILREIERQVDGVLYFDQANEVWKINLARGGYTVGSLPQITDDTLLAVESFTRGAWEDTTNEVRVAFADRNRDYFETNAVAQDTANVNLQGGKTITATENYPGVKDADLANNIAWRDLRTLSFPLAKFRCTVDRAFYTVAPGDVVAFTSTKLGLTQVPFRVQRIDYGELAEGRITLDLVQDLFEALDGSYSAPPGTNWSAPASSLVAIPANESVVLEAPRALVIRDPDNQSPVVPNRVFASAGYQSDGAVDFRIYQDETGSYIEDGAVGGFCLIGELDADLPAGTANPTGGAETITLDTSNFDSETDILDAFTTGASDDDTGLSLVNLIYIDGEFLAVQATSDGGTDLVDLDTVYRGMLDTVPKDHAAGTKVFLVMAASGLSESGLTGTASFNVKLRSRGFDGTELAQATATTIALAFEDRYRAPYPPTALELNTVAWDTSIDLDDFFDSDTSSGTDYEQMGLQVEFLRRDFRTVHEVDNLTTDALTADANFLTDTTTQYQVSLYNDPSGTNNLLLTKTWDGTSGNNLFELNRTEILNAMTTPGEVPSTLRVVVETRHTIDGDVVNAVNDIDYDFASASTALANDTNGGAVAQDAWATVFASAPDTGTYSISIGSAFPTNGNVEKRINGAGVTSVIPFGSTTGSITGVTAGDLVEIRHRSSDSGLEKFCQVDPPTSTAGGYAIFI